MSVYTVEELATHLIGQIQEPNRDEPTLESVLTILITLAESCSIEGPSRKRVVLAALQQLGIPSDKIEMASTLIEGIITLTKSPAFKKVSRVVKRSCLKFCK